MEEAKLSIHHPQNSELSSLDDLVRMVTDTLGSATSKRVYKVALTGFLAWHQAAGKPQLSKAVVQRYVDDLRNQSLSSSAINQKLSAVRKLVREAADNGLLDPLIAETICRVKSVKQRGSRLGFWLSKDQAEKLVNLPDTRTLAGLRDRAVLAVLIGCGLRRSEAANLTYGHLQLREKRWVIVDLVGKGNRVRSVPVPGWVKQALDAWTDALEMETGIEVHLNKRERIWRAINKGGALTGPRTIQNQCISDGYLSDQAVAAIVHEYGLLAGFDHPLDAINIPPTFPN